MHRTSAPGPIAPAVSTGVRQQPATVRAAATRHRTGARVRSPAPFALARRSLPAGAADRPEGGNR